MNLLTEPIPVLYLIATLDRAGAERQLVLLATHLDRSRFVPEVVCLTRGGPLEEDLRRAGVPCRILHKRGKLDLRALCELVGLMRRGRPAVVHTWLFTANAYGRFAARLAGVPVVVAGERCVDEWRRWWHRFIDRTLSRLPGAVVANCRAVRDFVVSEGVAPGRVRVIENGLDLAALEAAAAEEPLRNPLRNLEDRFLVVQVGRLEPQKGVLDLLEAIDILRGEVPGVMLLLIGDGPQRPTVEREVERRGLEAHVMLLGGREDVPALVARCDAVVLASRWEGLPNAIIEAMALRRPVVVTAVGGCAELVSDGRTGFLVPPADPPRLARALAVIHHDPALGLEMGSAAREAVVHRFSLERMVADYQHLYMELLGLSGRVRVGNR